jgi:hypothetical protein
MASAEAAVAAFARALAASDEEGSVAALVAALSDGAPPIALQRAIVRALAADGQQLHSMVYAAAAFDLAEGLGPDAGRYPLAAAAAQVARQAKNSDVARWVEGARRGAGSAARHGHSLGELERALFEALDGGEAARAAETAVHLHHASGDAPFVVEAFARWAGRSEVIEKPEGYVSHLPLQIDAARRLLEVAAQGEETDLLLAHLAYCQSTLSSGYQTRRVARGPTPALDAGDAMLRLRDAVHGGRVEELPGLLAAAAPRGAALDGAARVLMRCALEEQGGLSHRFTLAGAAWRSARLLQPPVGRALLAHAAVSIAHGYRGPRRLLEARDLPHPNPGGRDYAGRLLLGLASGNVPEAHAALRGLFEAGTSPRAAALPFLDAASQLDAHHLHTDHAFIITQAAWRALADGSFAAEALPLLAELAARIAKAPKDHTLIALVEDASASRPPARA